MDKVTVVIPVYNTPKDYLDECINSILKQTYKNFEIIIVDDGSKDETVLLCDEIALRDERIKVLHKVNEGVAVARNVGIDNATGKWIMFVDSDDYLKEDAMECLINESEDADIVISRIHKEEKAKIYGSKEKCKITTIEEKRKLINSMFYDKGSMYMYVDSVCSKLYLKSFLDRNNIRFIKGLTYGEDGIFNFRSYYLSKCINYIPAVTYIYRLNEKSVTHSISDIVILSHDRLFKEYENLLSGIADEEIYDGFYSYVIRQINAFCVRHIFNSKNNMTSKERNAKLRQVVEKEPYRTSIDKVKFKFLTIKRKIPAFLLKLKLYNLVRFLYNLIECMHGARNTIYAIKERKEKNK